MTVFALLNSCFHLDVCIRYFSQFQCILKIKIIPKLFQNKTRTVYRPHYTNIDNVLNEIDLLSESVRNIKNSFS